MLDSNNSNGNPLTVLFKIGCHKQLICLLLLSLRLQKEKGHYNSVVSVGPHAERCNIISTEHGRKQKCDEFCFIYRFSLSSFAFTILLRNIKKFGAKKLFYRPLHTMKARYGLRDSFLVCKMHSCYCRICRNLEEKYSIPSYSSNASKQIRYNRQTR